MLSQGYFALDFKVSTASYLELADKESGGDLDLVQSQKVNCEAWCWQGPLHVYDLGRATGKDKDTKFLN